jgi:hypothetical protein
VGGRLPTAWNNALFNSLMLRRNGPYQAPSWKQLRYGAHPVIRNHKKNSILSTRIKTSYDVQIGARKGNSITQVVEPHVYASEFPMIHRFNMGTGRSFNIELKNSYGNKLINFANYEINNLLNLQRNYDSGELYFNRINSMILRGENRDDSLNDALSNISAMYSQTVYPAAYNAFLARTRSRKHYSITDIWDNPRGLRSNAARENSQGTNITKQCIEYPSKWSTDAHHVYSSSVSFTYDDGAGELQNSYSRYMVEQCLRSQKVIYPAATYNARIPLGTFSSSVAAISGAYPAYVGDRYNLVMGTFSGSIAAAGSGKTPYKTYEEYSKHLRIIGKDYSIVPEFRISTHLEEYLEGEDFTTLSNIDDLLELTGSGYINSSEDGFFKEYSNSDFMKMFDLVNDAYDGADLVDGAHMTQDKIGLRCNAFLQFLPYKGFYPAERTLELASLFSQSFGAQVDKTANDVAQGAVYRAILEPLYSQGVMYNTIKSGIAVSNFIISNTSSAPATITGSTQSGSWMNPLTPALTSSNISASAVRTNVATSLPEGNVFFEYMLPPFASASGSYLGHPDGPYGGQKALWNENGYFFEKIPFEALYQPRNYLSEDYIPYTGRIYDTGLHSASLMEYASGSSTGQYDTSEANYVTWDGQGDRRYELAIDNFLCETINFFQNGLASITSAREEDFGAVTSGSTYTMKLKLYRPTTSSLGHAWADTGSIIPDYNKFDMYRRVSAFGPPIASKQYSTYLNFAGTGSYKASFSHLTPPYFAGSGSCTFTYTASADGSPTLDDIFAGLSISYDRMEFVELKNGGGSFGISDMSDYKVQLKDSFNLTQSINSVPAGTRTQKKQWLIQSKFETPIINITGDRRTCGQAEIAGAAATGLVALTSSVISSAAATGFIDLTGSTLGAVTATGSIKFEGRPNTTKYLYWTGSSGTGYRFIPTAGQTQAFDESNNIWYFNTGSDANAAAAELFGAMTASNFVAVDGATVTRASQPHRDYGILRHRRIWKLFNRGPRNRRMYCWRHVGRRRRD